MGKSGSFFFFSHDKKLIIKTMTTVDFKSWKKMSWKYFEHVNTQKDSLLARVYGVYKIQMDNTTPVYFVLMGTVAFNKEAPLLTFDLKGSLIDRYANETESIKKD